MRTSGNEPNVATGAARPAKAKVECRLGVYSLSEPEQTAFSEVAEKSLDVPKVSVEKQNQLRVIQFMISACRTKYLSQSTPSQACNTDTSESKASGC